MTQKLSGGCACGAIHYDCNADPVIMFNCHCRDCQRASGSAYAALVVGPKVAVQMHGELRYHKIVGSAGKAIERGFCPTCGSRDRQIGTAAQHPRIAGGKLGRPINVPTHDGRIYLKRAALGSHEPQGPKAHARRAAVMYHPIPASQRPFVGGLESEGKTPIENVKRYAASSAAGRPICHPDNNSG